VKQQRQMEFGRHGDVPGLQYQSYREGCGCEVWEGDQFATVSWC
jgi:hypothetical protein